MCAALIIEYSFNIVEAKTPLIDDGFKISIREVLGSENLDDFGIDESEDGSALRNSLALFYVVSSAVDIMSHHYTTPHYV